MEGGKSLRALTQALAEKPNELAVSVLYHSGAVTREWGRDKVLMGTSGTNKNEDWSVGRCRGRQQVQRWWDYVPPKSIFDGFSAQIDVF